MIPASALSAHLAASLYPPGISEAAVLSPAADLQTLAKLIPAQSRLMLNPGSLQDPPKPGAAVDMETAMVPTAGVRPGDIVRVLPGERMPVDGDIVEGKCSVDESMLTGESALVPKGQGQQVDSGRAVHL